MRTEVGTQEARPQTAAAPPWQAPHLSRLLPQPSCHLAGTSPRQAPRHLTIPPAAWQAPPPHLVTSCSGMSFEKNRSRHASTLRVKERPTNALCGGGCGRSKAPRHGQKYSPRATHRGRSPLASGNTARPHHTPPPERDSIHYPACPRRCPAPTVPLNTSQAPRKRISPSAAPHLPGPPVPSSPPSPSQVSQVSTHHVILSDSIGSLSRNLISICLFPDGGHEHMKAAPASTGKPGRPRPSDMPRMYLGGGRSTCSNRRPRRWEGAQGVGG